MGGGLIQLVSKSSQDVYLTGNPQITFFKVVYKKYTNFSVESIEQVIKGDIKNKLSCKFNRDGDLLYKVYLDYVNNQSHMYPNNFGNFLINDAEILIGGQRIDLHTGHWMEVYSRLNTQYKTSIDINDYLFDKNISSYQQLSCSCGMIGKKTDKIIGKISIPFNFWFCKNPGLALPLIALQYNEVNLNIRLNQTIDLLNDLNLNNFKIMADYIYLDTDERRRFAQVSHEYLIEQVQINEHVVIDGTNTILLNFNNPVKELIFSPKWNNNGSIPGIGNNNTLISLNINTHNIFDSDRDLYYFTRTQIYEKYKGNPLCLIDKDNTNNNEGKLDGVYDNYNIYDYIGVYSFSLNPNDYQPSGSFNFSTVQTCNMTIKNISPPIINNTIAPKQTYNELRTLVFYATNYNILRIVSGIGALSYVS